MPEPTGTALALFAKAPLPGRVKTRLASALGAEAAADFHRVCVRAVWERVATDPRMHAYLYCDGFWADFEGLAGERRFRRQRGADLGERMRNCLAELLSSGYRKALIVGSDAPTLPEAQVREALAALDDAEIVLCPSLDGGFTLIGATRTDRAMFRGVAWSRTDTRDACLEALRAAGLAAVEAPTPAYDVDVPADLDRLRRDPALQPRLRRWLAARAADPS